MAQVIALGSANIPDDVLAFLESAAGQERTAARNLAALARLGFVPGILRGVDTVDTHVTLLGHQLDHPILPAPIGAVDMFHPQGAAAVAGAAAGEGGMACVGILSAPAIEDVVRQAGARHFFQMYPDGDEAWMRALIARVEDLGLAGICLTADRPVKSRSDRLVERRYDWYSERVGPPPNLATLGHERWRRASFSWKDLESFRAFTTLPIILKGVMREDDAVRAIDCGMDAIYVSNHGGRGMDHGLSSIEVLPRIARSVGGRVPVLVDSGFRTGGDVAKALALGADAVLIGRPQCWGLAMDGADGVARVLQILSEELRVMMGMLGAGRVSDLRDVMIEESPAG